MKNKAIFLITFVFIFTTSCEDEDQITGDVIEPDLPVYIQTDMSGFDGGDSEHLGNLYYNFLSDNSYNHEFYKFNNYHLSGGSHNGAEDLLTLKTYQSVYYVPSSSILGEDNSLVQYENEYYCISCCSNSEYTNISDCLLDNNTWSSSCNDPQYNNEDDCIANSNIWSSSCSNSGHCSNTLLDNEDDCTNGGYFWTSYDENENACIGDNNTWNSSNYDYVFTVSNNISEMEKTFPGIDI